MLLSTLPLSHALLAIALSAVSPLALQAQTTSNCSADLERLVAKVETNYAGFQLEHRPNPAAYERHLAAMRSRAAAISGDACFNVYRDFVAFFDDPHLFISQSTRLDSAETAHRAAGASMLPLTEGSVRAYLRREADRLDPIEGIWYDRALRLAVVRDSTVRDRFNAVVLTSDTSLWRPGALRARLTRRADGRYDVELWSRNFSRSHLIGRIHRNAILRLSPGMWGREFPLAAADRQMLDPRDVHRPVLVRRDSVVILTVPSHDPTYRPRLDSLVREHRDALTSATYLVVDLRGNEGGASFTTNSILPFVMSTERREPLFHDFGEAVMLSSPDQIRYVQRFMVFGGDTTPRVQRLLARLRAQPGTLVPLSDSLDPPPAPADSVIPGDRRVAILVDGGTVSAAEAFLLRAMRSTRVTVFGEPTAGALDYQSVAIVPFQARGNRWYLGYPTITASASLPRGGMRGKGIAPHVSVDWSEHPDAIAFVVKALAAAGREH